MYVSYVVVVLSRSSMWKPTFTVLSSLGYEWVVVMNKNKRLHMCHIWGVQKWVLFWGGGGI